MPYTLHHIRFQVPVSLQQAHLHGVQHHQIQTPQAVDPQQPVSQLPSHLPQAMKKYVLFSSVIWYLF